MAVTPPRRPPPPLPLKKKAAKASASNAPAAPAEAADAVYQPGDVICDRYMLTSILGEGGMGAVWQARNLTLDIDVALKLIRAEVASAESSKRLLQEARAAARLGHPSIVRVFEFGQTEHGHPFIAMDLLQGEMLGDVLDRKGRLSATHAVATMLPVVSALAAAHAKGIVHRDMKPENIMLVPDESGAIVPKILDFGIAQLRQEGFNRKITQERTIVGTPDYMSPEHANGVSDVDGRSDQWAVAVILYEAMTGCRPFEGPSYNAVMIAVVTADPRPITELGAGDAELWAILERALAKNKDDRWHDMRELGAALAGWALDRGIDADVAGTSLHAHWLSGRRSMSSTPPVEFIDIDVEMDAGRAAPAAAPSSMIATINPPPPAEDDAPQPSRGRSWWPWIAATAVVGAAFAFMALRTPPVAAPAAPSADPAPAALTAAAPTAATPERATEPPPASAGASATVAPSSRRAPSSGGKPRVKTTGLPIPARPNF